MFFTGRTEEQSRFRLALSELGGDSGIDEGHVVLVRGHGGIGKSSLLERYRSIATGELEGDKANRGKFLVARMDWEADQRRHPTDYTTFAGPPVWRILERVRAALDEALAGLPARRRLRVAKAFEDFRRRVSTLPELEERAKRLAVPTELGRRRMTSDDYVALAQGARGLATVAGHPHSSAIPVADIAKGAHVAAGAIEDYFVGQIDPGAYRTLVDEVDAIVEAFCQGMRTISRKRPVVMILDTCELLGESDEWLRLCTRKCGRRVLWVIGTRLEAEQNADNESASARYLRDLSESRLRDITLTRFDDRSLSAYLTERLGDPLPDGVTVEAVAEITRGVPLAVSLTADLIQRGEPLAQVLAPITQQGQASKVVRQIARRYLIHTRTNADLASDLDLLYGLALLYGDHRHDPGLLAALWNIEPGAVAATMDGLVRRHDFVLSAPRRLHEEVRETIRLYLLDADNRATVSEMNRRAVEFLRQQMEGAEHQNIEDQVADEEWRDRAVALLWHTYWVVPKKGVSLLCELFPPAAVLHSGLSTALLRVAGQFTAFLPKEDQRLTTGLAVLRRSWHDRVEPDACAAVARLTPTLPEFTVWAPTPEYGVYHSLLSANAAAGIGKGTLERLSLLRGAAGHIRPGSGPTATALGRVASYTNWSGPWLRDWNLLSYEQAEIQRGLQDGLQLAVEYLPDSVNARVDLAVVLHYTGRPAESVAVAYEAVRLHPDHVGAHVSLASILRLHRGFPEAEAAARRAIELNPEHINAHVLLAMILSDSGQPGQAEPVAREAIALGPDHVNAHVALARVLGSLGSHGEAEIVARRAVRLDPEHVQAHVSLGHRLADLSRFEEAEAEAREAVRLRPENIGAQLLLGAILIDRSRWHEAESVLRRAVRLFPESVRGHLALGTLLLDYLGRGEDAKHCFDEAARLDPTRPDHWLAWYYLTSGDHDAARTRLTRALAKQDDLSAITYLLLGALDRQFDSEVAGVSFAAALDRLERPGRSSVSDFNRGEGRALTLIGLGRPDEALVALQSAMRSRTGRDVFLRPLYELFATPDRAPGLDGLLDIWRQVIAAEPSAAGSWAGVEGI